MCVSSGPERAVRERHTSAHTTWYNASSTPMSPIRRTVAAVAHKTCVSTASVYRRLMYSTMTSRRMGSVAGCE